MLVEIIFECTSFSSLSLWGGVSGLRVERK